MMTLLEIEQRLDEIGKQIGQLAQNVSNTTSSTRIEVVKVSIDNRLEVISKQIGQLVLSISNLGNMTKTQYDMDGDGIVDLAAGIYDGNYQATAAQINTAVNKTHTRNKDIYLDKSGSNEVSAAEIREYLDDPSAIFLDLNDTPSTYIGSGSLVVAVKASADGLEFVSAGIGDMIRAIYDTNSNGIVDKSETIDDGTNSATASEVEDTVDKSHEHTTSNDIAVRWIYLIGNESTDGSVRMGMSGSDCVWQLRIVGSWETIYGVGVL